MDKDSCLIYEGTFYKVEWYFDETGYSQAFDTSRKNPQFKSENSLSL